MSGKRYFVMISVSLAACGVLGWFLQSVLQWQANPILLSLTVLCVVMILLFSRNGRFDI